MQHTADVIVIGAGMVGAATACMLARALTAEAIKVIPRKPVESGCQRQGQELIASDALALKNAANYPGDLNLVCPYRFEPAISPDRAARLANTALNIEQLKAACLNEVNPDTDFLLVEGAGGFYSPMCSDGLNADLAQALDLPVVLVAEDRLGCINHILLSLETISARRLAIQAVILNPIHNDPSIDLDMNNFLDLKKLIDLPVYSLKNNAKDSIKNCIKSLI